MKTCKQCGMIKPLDQYRNYYGGRKGTYTTCKDCERVNARAKYLSSKAELADWEALELEKIYKLYSVQRAAGFSPPNTTTTRRPVLSLDEQIARYEKLAAIPHYIDEDIVAPAELQKWLVEELTEDPDYYIEEVYEDLRSKFYKQLYIDESTMLPVYDQTYKKVLEQILERFYKYEEE